MASNSKQAPCPCGASNNSYEQCCAPFIRGEALPQTAAQLMRSRYTAYGMQEDAYLLATWHPTTRPTEQPLTESGVKWLGLDIKGQTQSGEQASVEFVARYKIGGRAQRLHEVSRFVHENGRWYYVDGYFPEDK